MPIASVVDALTWHTEVRGSEHFHRSAYNEFIKCTAITCFDTSIRSF